MADTRGGICLSTTPSTVIEGHFSPKLKTYFFLQGALPLVITVVGILLLPLGHFRIMVGGALLCLAEDGTDRP